MQDFGITDRTIATLLADGAARLGQKPFLLYEDRRFGWAEAEAISNRLAHGLRAWGVVRGEHVAVLMDNRPEQVWLFFALMKLGAVVVPVNTAARGELLVYYLRQSRARALVVEAEFAGRFAQVRDQCGEIERLALLDETDELAGTAYAELLADDASPISAGGAFNDLALLSYTSGTTGPSKGNMATQAHMLGCGHDVARIFGYGADDVLYTCLPVFHGNAWLAGVLPTLWADATLAVSRRFSASNFWSEARRHGATQFNALGAMINIIWSQPERADDADNPVRQCMVVPTPKEFYHAFEKRFDLTLTTVYALTDFGFATLKPADAPAEKWASAGRVRPACELRIVDDEDFELPAGEIGEIVLRPRDPWFQPLGYFDMGEATLAAWRNLWFHTGDRGWVDSDGWLYFADRKKDSIRRRGENISSYEVEQIIMKHDAVEDVAAYAFPAEMLEDEVMVSVVTRPGASLSEAELIVYCRDNMAYFMMPRFVEFRDGLPRTMSEKVEKYKLRQAAEERRDKIWDREKAGIEVRR